MGISSSRTNTGFTIVELLIVVIVIGILATLVLVGYTGVTNQAKTTKIKSDLTALANAVKAARVNMDEVMGQVTGNYYTAGSCVGLAAGTDLAALSQTSSCWSTYLTTLNNISTAGNVHLGDVKDPWGRPYFIDENEGENGNCGQDLIGVYALPFSGSSLMNQYSVNIPRYGSTGCPVP